MIPDGVVANAPAVALISAVPIKCAVKTALLPSTAATRSPATTPPVLFSKIQEVAATLATKLFNASLVTANTVIEFPDANDCAGTTVPEPFAAVSIFTLDGKPGFTVKVCTFESPPPPVVKTVTG